LAKELRSVKTAIFFLLVLIAVFISLGARCFYLQYSKNEHYNCISVKQQQKLVTQTPQRGEILDCRGRVLAASSQIQIIFADPREIDEPKDTSLALAPVVNMGAHNICRLICESRNPRFKKIKVGASETECRKAGRIHGVGVQSVWQRYYPAGELAAHVVGFTSKDNRGLAGIELQYEQELAGVAAKHVFFADARRRSIRLKEQAGHLSDGVGLILSIDAAIQHFARAELVKQYESYEAESAVAIVAEPKTGAILAMASLPDFNPGDFGSADASSYRNRALTDQFEPGSILKPIAMAIGLDAGVVNKGQKIFCEDGDYRAKGIGRIGEYGNRRYGSLTMREILVKSSNIGMAKIGQKLGKYKLYKGLRLFGFGERTGVELPGEAEGLLREADKWTGYSVTRIPFGQEISVSAVQLVRAFCVLANGGHAVRPYVVKAVVDSDGEVVKLKRPAPPVGFVVEPEVARWIVTEAMVGVVNEGTGRRAKLKGWQVFGKTGTANIAKSNERGYSDKEYVASFVAGAPAEDPAVVVLVSIRKPNIELGKGYTGGRVASPVAGRILERTLNYLQVAASK
jgi:cell division protein FtsI/penicillin-binding protein 2